MDYHFFEGSLRIYSILLLISSLRMASSRQEFLDWIVFCRRDSHYCCNSIRVSMKRLNYEFRSNFGGGVYSVFSSFSPKIDLGFNSISCGLCMTGFQLYFVELSLSLGNSCTFSQMGFGLNLKLLVKAILLSSIFSVGLPLSFFNCYFKPIDSLFYLEGASLRSKLKVGNFYSSSANRSYFCMRATVFLCSLSWILPIGESYSLEILASSIGDFNMKMLFFQDSLILTLLPSKSFSLPYLTRDLKRLLFSASGLGFRELLWMKGQDFTDYAAGWGEGGAIGEGEGWRGELDFWIKILWILSSLTRLRFKLNSNFFSFGTPKLDYLTSGRNSQMIQLLSLLIAQDFLDKILLSVLLSQFANFKDCIGFAKGLISFKCLCRISSKSIEMDELLEDILSTTIFLLATSFFRLSQSKLTGIDQGSFILLLSIQLLEMEKLLEGSCIFSMFIMKPFCLEGGSSQNFSFFSFCSSALDSQSRFAPKVNRLSCDSTFPAFWLEG